MTTVAQHITPGTVHGVGVGLIPPLPEEDILEESLTISLQISPPPEFSSKSLTPPPVAKKPDRLLKKRPQGTPPPAPTRSSSILTSRDTNTSSKESSPLVNQVSSDESDFSSLDKPNIHRTTSASIPATSHYTNRSQTLRTRASASPSGPDSVSSSLSGSFEGRRIHSAFSTSQPQLNMIDSGMLVKPKDRIRSILVGDADEEDSTLENDYGSGYNTTLMKISHGDVHKHAVAVTTPVVPPVPPYPVTMKQTTPDRDSSDGGINQGDSGNANVSPKERAHKSPYHSKMDEVNEDPAAKATDLTKLAMSDPIARAYRQHLMTKMEQNRKVGFSEMNTTNASYTGHKEVSFTRSWEPAPAPSDSVKNNTSSSGTTRTLSSQLQALDMPDGSGHAQGYMSASYAQKNNTLSNSSSYSGEIQNKNSGNSNYPSEQHNGATDRTGSPSIMESVKFFEKAQTSAAQSKSSSGSYYGTLPRSHQYYNRGPSSQQKTTSLGDFRNKAKSIDNLSLACESNEQQWSTMPKQRFSPGLSRQDFIHPSHGSTNAIEATGNLSSSCSSSLGSCTPSPQSRRANLGQSANFAASGRVLSQRNSSEGSAGQQVSRLNSSPGRAYPKSPVPPTSQKLNGAVSTQSEQAKENRQNPNAFSFADYISFYSTQLPKRVKLTRPLSKDFNKVSLSSGDTLDLHFVKKIKAVEVVDSNNISFVMPVNSVANLSIFYDPFGVEKMAGLGFCFKTAGSIMDLKVQPSVVASQQNVDGGSADNSLVKGEILVVQGVRNIFHGRLLKVFSLGTKSVKFLDEGCDASFTTDPASIKMSLTQIYEHSILLPQKAMLYFSRGITETLPESLSKNPVSLKRFIIHKVVVASPLLHTAKGSTETQLLELDASLNLDIEEVPVDEEKQKVSLQVTQNLVNSSAYKFAIPFLDYPDPALHAAQCALLANLKPNTLYGTKIVPSHGINVPAGSSSLQETVHRPNGELRAHASSTNDQRLKNIENKQVLLEAKVSGMCDLLDDTCRKVNKVFNYLNKAQTAMKEHKRLLSSKTDENRDRSVSMGGSSGSSTHSASSRPVSESTAEVYSTRFSPKPLQAKSATLPKLPSTSSIHDDNADEVFIARGPKPPILPKPKIVPNKTASSTKTNLGKNSPPQDKMPAKRTVSGPTPKSRGGSLSSSKLSTSSSTRQSVDLSDYLLTNPKAKTGSLERQKSPTSMKQSEGGTTGVDGGDLDIANWCSQIEDELTKLYNESILAMP